MLYAFLLLGIAHFIFSGTGRVFEDLPGATFFIGCIDRGGDWNRVWGNIIYPDTGKNKNIHVPKALVRKRGYH